MRDTIKIKQHGTTKIVAHRGVSGLETENTAAAYIAAGTVPTGALKPISTGPQTDILSVIMTSLPVEFVIPTL